ncbi:Uncharacterized protein dnm_070590 [Desulfonema magnum]|uniref:Uncharacterized protein n=1 Tax=Desulfonema magnum TaxID=45655 RepID=A0A975BSV0_9BACT|nr:Uncharacterized protein dnm_070590 [Desulfonema magnum]
MFKIHSIFFQNVFIIILSYSQQIEKFSDCVRENKETRLFSWTKCLPGRKNPGFSPARHVRTATARKLFDLLRVEKNPKSVPRLPDSTGCANPAGTGRREFYHFLSNKKIEECQQTEFHSFVIYTNPSTL